MRILVGKINKIALFCLIAGWGVVTLSAQTQSSVSSASTGSPATQSTVQAAANQASQGNPSSDATGAGAATSSTLDYIFNHKAQNGTVAKEASDANSQAKENQAAADATGDKMDPDVRVRFDTYLGMNEVPQDQLQAYADEFNKVVQLLRDGKTFEAWRELHVLAQYQEVDAGISGDLANRVESIWDTDRATNVIAEQNQKLADNSDTASRSADMMSDEVRDKDLEYQRRLAYAQGKNGVMGGSSGGNAGRSSNQGNSAPNGGASQTNSSGASDDTSPSPDTTNIMGKLQLTDQYLQTLQDKAKIKLNDMKAEKMMDQAKSDFADYIKNLYQSGCYSHVLIAADFYRHVFDADQQPVTIDQQINVSQGEYPVEMAQEVNASLQITRDVRNSIDVFNNDIAENNVSAATDRLEQAFVTNEFAPELLGIELSKKKKVDAFTKALDKMRNLIEARDFAGLDDLLSELKQIAPDFDATKAMAIVNAVKLDSQLHLGKAKLAAQQGDQKTALDEFQAAAESWPSNPDLKDKALGFFNSQDVQTQALADFDRLVADNNYRAIFDKQLAFAPAMKDDTKRQQQLKDALSKVQEAEAAVQKANVLVANGDACGAWETINLAVKDLPDDLKLNSMLGQLAGKSAEFVSAVSKAKDAEAKNELGYSLTWYAIAQRDYPASSTANDGIDRISKEILAKQL